MSLPEPEGIAVRTGESSVFILNPAEGSPAGGAVEDAERQVNETASSVNNIVDTMNSMGSSAFAAAQAAIEELSAFQAIPDTAQYDAPAFTLALDLDDGGSSGSVGGGEYIGGGSGTGLDLSTPTLPVSVTTPDATVPTAAPPSETTVSEIGAVGGIDTSGLPVQPAAFDPTIPVFTSGGAAELQDLPDIGDVARIQIDFPALADLDVPSLSYTPPVFNEPLPDLVNVIPPLVHEPALPWLVEENRRMMQGGLGGDSLVLAILSRAKAVSNSLNRIGTSWLEGRGDLADASVVAALQVSRGIHATLDAADYDREALIVLEQWRNDSYASAMEACGEIQAYMIDLHIAMARHVFDAHAASAESLLSLIEAAVKAYNAVALGAKMKAAEFRAALQEERARLMSFRAEAKIEQSRQRINESLSQGYASDVAVETLKGTTYAAEAAGFEARVREYVARASVTEALADAVRTKLEQAGSELTAYIAQLGLYESEYQVYSANERGTQAMNSVSAIKARVSVSGFGAIDAENDSVIAKVRGEGANLQAKTLENIVQARNDETVNTLAVGIDSMDVANFKKDAAETDVQNHENDAYNQAVAEEARQAVNYLQQVSESLRRAATVSQQALAAATKANATAAEAAGRAGSSIAAAAYSAVHVQASIGATASRGASRSASYSSETTASLTKAYSETT